MDLNAMMQQAQQMQANMMKAQEELANTEFTHSANGVSVTVKGDMTLVSLSIDEQLIKDAADDKEMLEDFIQLAVTTAMKKAKDESASKMSGLTGGLNIPGLNI